MTAFVRGLLFPLWGPRPCGGCAHCSGPGGGIGPGEECPAEPDVCPAFCETGIAIGPHLPALEAGLLELWRRATVECGECEGVGTVSIYPESGLVLPGNGPGNRGEDCPGCAGLGRVRRE